MDMGGITVRYAPGEAAVRAVLAGADALLMPPVPDAAFEGLQGAVRSGRISIERLDASVRRILEAKAMLGLDKTRIVDINAINQKLGSIAWQKEAQDISDRGITLLRDTPHALPIDGTKPNRALLLAFYADPEPYPGEDLERELKSRFDSVTTLRADTRFINASNLKLPDPRHLRHRDSRAVCPRERSQGQCGRARRAGGRCRSALQDPASRSSRSDSAAPT